MARLSLEQWEQLAEAAGYNSRKLAKLCGESLRQLERDFHAEMGRPPQDWLNEQRLKAAQNLLLSGKPVKEVSFELGFKQPSHFCRQFKSANSLTPSQYIAQARNETHVAAR